MKVFESVQGLDDRVNMVVYSPPRDFAYDHVVYFPGDVQDFESTMSQLPSCRDYLKFSYEATISALSGHYPTSHIWLIPPAQKTYQTISVYKNFVRSESILGNPVHSTDFQSLRHLELLLSNATQMLIKASSSSTSSDLDALVASLKPDAPLRVIGFSKGCIVLNQFLYEMSITPDSPFLGRLSSIIWLDGGHNGEEHVWVTDPEVIAALTRPCFSHIKYSIHVTPYQVCDEHRPWKGEQKSKFVELLHEHNLHFSDALYFEDESASISSHFKILFHFAT